MMKLVNREGAPPAPVWIDEIDPGPDGRPLLLFYAYDAAMMEQIGADPDDVHTRYLIDDGGPRGRQWAEEAERRGWTPSPPEVLTSELRGACETFDEMDRDELAEVVRDETHSPYGRMLAYAFYLDLCSKAELEAEMRWKSEAIDRDDFRGMLHSRN